MTPWYNIFGSKYVGDEPCFYDKEDFPWTKILEDNWQTIRDEIRTLLEQPTNGLKPYSINKAMSFPPRHWKTMGFYFWKYRMHKNCRRCPETTRILESIPNMTAGSLSVLEPGSNINPHQGDTDAIVRCHLGLSIPAGMPDCAFQVGKDIRPWEEGKAHVFCDAQTHTAWNQTDQRRLILIVDVVRPEFAKQTDTVCSHVLAAAVMQMLYQSSSLLNRLPGQMKRLLYSVSRLAIRAFVPLQRRLRLFV